MSTSNTLYVESMMRDMTVISSQTVIGTHVTVAEEQGSVIVNYYCFVKEFHNMQPTRLCGDVGDCFHK